MCGIVGYVGKQDAQPILINGLKKLEYRGYDSAGICSLNGQLEIYKAKGRISQLEQIIPDSNTANVGIGHTRWATHGQPSDDNAHPHLDCTGKIAVVHNGIIENYQELRATLQEKGHAFKSETDTEVISHLVEEYYEGDILQAVRKALKDLKGSFALAVISQDHGDKLIVARQDSPLVIGIGEKENYIASDIPAILEYTRNIYVLEDGEMAMVTAGKVEVYDQSEQIVQKALFEITWDPIQAEKEGYPDFMLKEIHEQGKAIKDTLAGRLSTDGQITLDGEVPAHIWQGVTNIHFTACGTAFHACLYGKDLLDQFLDIPIVADLASEYRYKRNKANKGTLLIVVSQSGETADTLGAMRLAKKNGARVVAISNVVGSTLSREADAVLYTHAGPEIAVASTKAYTTQLACLSLLALFLKEKLGDGTVETSILQQMQLLAEQVDVVLAAHEYRIEQYAKKLAKWEDTFFLGRGLDYATVMEGQLKLKEISYIHGEALAGGELKHGTLALIEPGVPVVAVLTQPHLIEKMKSNLKEVKARGGEVLVIAMANTADYSDVADELWLLPKTEPMLAPLLSAIALQLLAYYAACHRGCDVDKPRNLAKSVTVE